MCLCINATCKRHSILKRGEGRGKGKDGSGKGGTKKLGGKRFVLSSQSNPLVKKKGGRGEQYFRGCLESKTLREVGCPSLKSSHSGFGPAKKRARETGGGGGGGKGRVKRGKRKGSARTKIRDV